MRRAVLSLLLLSGTSCRQIFGLHELTSDGGANGDTNGDSPPGGDGPSSDTVPLGDAPAGCLGAGSFAVCFAQQPAGDQLGLTGPIDTDADIRCQPMQPTGWTASQPAACFIYAGNISTAAGTTLTATGTRPLVLVATNDITLAGAIDVASHGKNDGASADYAGCAAGTAPAIGSRGGGAGGSFTTSGSNGGAGGTGGGAGGAAGSTLPASTSLHGGCRGQAGDGADSSGRGASGGGGGVVYIVAGGSITISGAVDASGGGARGAESAGGGGGGGSGGMIVIVAPAIDLTGAYVYADGGGGGGGGSAGAPGGDGSDPTSTTPGLGGQFYAAGGAGYHDSIGATAPSTGATPGTGGGGGGGGAGYIVFAGTITPAARVSPPAM